MATDNQLASIRVGWEVATTSGPYAGEVAQYGLSLGIERASDKWDKSTPFYRGRSGTVRTTWHEIAATNYTATVAWEADLDDGAGIIDSVCQADILAAAWTMGTYFMATAPSSSKLSAITLSPRTHWGATSKGSTGTAAGATRAVVGAGKAVGTLTSALPPEVAMAISTYGVGNLRTSRGRAYIGPLGGTLLAANGTLETGALSGSANAVKAFVEAMHAIGPSSGGGTGADRLLPWVFNPYAKSLAGDDFPKGSPITSIRYDNRPDSQRRRESSYRPAKTVVAVASW